MQRWRAAGWGTGLAAHGVSSPGAPRGLQGCPPSDASCSRLPVVTEGQGEKEKDQVQTAAVTSLLSSAFPVSLKMVLL